MTQIILVRHGQTEWNRVERFRGRADVPLNTTGLVQAQATAARIAASWPPAAILAGPLLRTLQTGQAIAVRCQQTVTVEPRLIDIDYGAWQGLTPAEVRERWPEQLAAWYETPHLARIPGGELLAAVRERALAVVAEVAARFPAQSVVLVSHTVVNRALVLGALGLSDDRFWRLRQEPCAINVLEAEDSMITLVTFNDTCHLGAL